MWVAIGGGGEPVEGGGGSSEDEVVLSGESKVIEGVKRDSQKGGVTLRG